MSHQSLPAFASYSGARQPKLLLVGEAWGRSEAELRKPFVGESGKELFRILGEAIPAEPELHREALASMRYGLGWIGARDRWINAVGIGMTNVLAFQPPGNKIESLCCSKTELPDKGKTYARPSLSQGKYLHPDYFGELDRLATEIRDSNPNLIVALGNTACWAVLGSAGIGGLRGTVASSDGCQTGRGRVCKALATYHPAGVMRNWSWRPIVVADCIKGWRECQFPDIRRPERRVAINPSEAELAEWVGRVIDEQPSELSVDIETAVGMITCIGFGRSPNEAMVVPFRLLSAKDGSYWPDNRTELRVWGLVEKLLASPIPKVFQNGVYDLQYLFRMGLTVNNCREDTMLLHHSIMPEMNKGLGFLGSIYTSEPAWKLMRKRKSDEKGVKADE